MARKRVNHFGTILEVELYCCKLGARVYDVFLIEGNWPTLDMDLVSCCNSQVVNTKGGYAEWGEQGSKHKIVTVYT